MYFPTPPPCTQSGQVSHYPLKRKSGYSSISSPLSHPVINRFPPTKETPKAFLSQNGFSQYLTGSTVDTDKFGALEDFFSPENAVGIAIDNERNSVEEGQLYTSERMRLREHSRLVAYASFQLNGREARSAIHRNNRILVGGERGYAPSAQKHLTIKVTKHPEIKGTRVKYVLLTPAIFVAVWASRRMASQLGLTRGWCIPFTRWTRT